MMKKFFRFLKNELQRLQRLIYYRVYFSPRSEKDIVHRFHKLYYDSVVTSAYLGLSKFWELQIKYFRLPDLIA